jgi:hypothetical protein
VNNKFRKTSRTNTSKRLFFQDVYEEFELNTEYSCINLTFLLSRVFTTKNEHLNLFAKIKKHRSENLSHLAAPAKSTRILYLQDRDHSLGRHFGFTKS